MLENELKEFRINHNLTQRQMAKKLKTSQSYYNTIERGVAKPGFTMIKRISRLLKLDETSIRAML